MLLPGQTLTARECLLSPDDEVIALPEVPPLHFTAPEGGAPEIVPWTLPVAALHQAIHSAPQNR